jgi:uncharacterized protein YegJ (DUF2314 family)
MFRIKFEDLGIMVLEPGNFTKVKNGEPIKIDMSDWSECRHVLIAYCPDVVRLSIDINNLDHKLDLEEFDRLLKESQGWRENDRAVM